LVWFLSFNGVVHRSDQHVSLRELSHAVIRTPSHMCIVMELCRGGELFDRIVSKEKYDENDARHIVIRILQGVKYLHDHGIVHRSVCQSVSQPLLFFFLVCSKFAQFAVFNSDD
jgi:serine/threonine protein kinase